MYFHNKLIWSHNYKYYSLEIWSNVNYFVWHATHSCMFPWTERVLIMKYIFYGKPSRDINVDIIFYKFIQVQGKLTCSNSKP